MNCARVEQLVQIDPGLDAEAVQHVDDVFGRDIAGRAFRVRTTTKPRDRAVEDRQAAFERGVDVSERLSVRVVVVRRERRQRNAPRGGFDHRSRLPRRAGADRVAERDLVAAHVPQTFGHVGNRLGADFAFVRAAEDTREIAAHANAMLLCCFGDRPETLETLVDRAVDVLLRERLRSRGEHHDFLRARSDRSFESFEVRHEHRDKRCRACAGCPPSPRRCRPSAAPTSATRTPSLRPPADPRRSGGR